MVDICVLQISLQTPTVIAPLDSAVYGAHYMPSTD